MQHEESLLRMPALLPALLRRPLRRPPVSRSSTLLGRRRAAAAAAAAAAIEVCCRACGGGRRLEPEPPLPEPLSLTEGAVRLVLELVGRMHGEGPTGVESEGGAQTSVSWRSGGLAQRQIVLRAAPSFSQSTAWAA